MKQILFVIFSAVTFIACNNNTDIKNSTTQANKPFSLPVVPNMIHGKEERIAYLCEHFWDNLNTNDTILLRNSEKFEEYFALYLTFLKSEPIDISTKNIASFLNKTGKNNVWSELIMQMATKYLYHIESPLLSEELYIPFAQYALSTPNLSIKDSILYTHRLEVAQKNRPGSKANDFPFVTSKGKQTTLHKSTDRCTLLFFNDPECENCKEAKFLLTESDIIRQMTENGTLQPIMIYTEGDSEVWKQHKHDCPKGWISGFDAEENIRMRRIYELRAMPCIYLIDKDKKVILKDADINTLITYLNSLGGV